jgi:hypothetical protein
MRKKTKTDKVDYDFIEIGTAFFDTLIEKATNERGLSVEPIKEYLDKLPEKPNVTKINGAVVADEDEKGLDVFYVEEADIDRYNLGIWMKGCNSVGKPHDFHTNYFVCPWTWHNHPNRASLPTQNLVSAGIVKQKKIPCYTYKALMEQYNIGKVKQLKIDTEGYDCKILNSVLDYYKDTPKNLPEFISFESNAHSSPLEVKKMTQRLSELNYTISYTEDGCVTEARKK